MLKKSIFCVVIIFTFIIVSNAQTRQTSDNNSNIIIVGAKKTISTTGKIGYVIIKETANAGWETTKFSGKEILAPLTKLVLVKVPAKTAKFVLKKSAPASKKLIANYLKYKLPI